MLFILYILLNYLKYFIAFLHKVNNHIVKGIVSKKASSCPVIFYYIMPEDLRECPFIVTVLVGQHNHPSPPPRKTPYNIKNQLQQIIDGENILDLTARRLLTGILYYNTCRFIKNMK